MGHVGAEFTRPPQAQQAPKAKPLLSGGKEGLKSGDRRYFLRL